MRHVTIILIALTLAACAPSPTVGEASVILAQATAQAVSTQQAISVASTQQALGIIAERAALDLERERISIAQTQTAIDEDRALREIELADAQAAAAIRKAEADAAIAQASRIAEESANRANIVGWIGDLAIIGVIVFVAIMIMVAVRSFIFSRSVRPIYDPASRSIIIYDHKGHAHYPPSAPALTAATTEQGDDFAPDIPAEVDGDQLADIPVYRDGQVESFISRDGATHTATASYAQRSECLRLVRMSISVYGINGKQIISRAKSKMASETWSAIIRMLGDDVEAVPQIGTYVASKHGTLGVLYAHIGSRNWSPTIIHRSPAPSMYATAEAVP